MPSLEAKKLLFRMAAAQAGVRPLKLMFVEGKVAYVEILAGANSGGRCGRPGGEFIGEGLC